MPVGRRDPSPVRSEYGPLPAATEVHGVDCSLQRLQETGHGSQVGLESLQIRSRTTRT